MRLFYKLRCRFASLFRRNGKNDELAREIEQHIELSVADLVSKGSDPEEARKTTLREFGNVELMKEECQDSWGMRTLFNLIRDLRYLLRNIRATKGSSILVVIIMAFGIGISMTMFSFVKGLLWNDIGFADEDRIVSVTWAGDLNSERRPIRIADYFDLAESNQVLESLVGFMQNDPSFVFGGADAIPENHTAASVTLNFFDLLGIQPLLGRAPVQESANGPNDERSTVLSYSFWQSRFGGDPNVIGMVGRVAGQPARIVGVMPSEYSGFPTNHKYWVVADFFNEWGPEQPRGQRRPLNVIGFLKEGISYQQAEANLDAIANRLAEEYPASNENFRKLRVRNYNENMLTADIKNLLYLLLFCGAMVLLVSSANVSNLMLARAARRSFELSIRNALGASKSHIMYQVILEGFLLTLIGTFGGLFITSFGCNYISEILSDLRLPFWWQVRLDPSSILVAIGAMTFASLAASFAPALRSSRQDSFSMLRDDSRTSSSLFMGKLSKALVGLQIALALALTTVAIVMFSVQYSVASQKTTYDPDKIVTASYYFGPTNGFAGDSDVHALQRTLTERMLELGAENVGFILQGGSLGGQNMKLPFEKLGEQYEDTSSMPIAGVLDISPSYFDVYGFENAISGRLLSATDTAESQPVAVVSRTFALLHFPQSDAVGQRIRFPNRNGQESEWLEIVGVVENYAAAPLPGETLSNYAIAYRPYSQNSTSRSVTIAVKFREDGGRWMETLRREVAKLAPYSTPRNFGTLREQQSLQRKFITLLVELFVVFGCISFLVASIGLYAVISFSAAQRFKEFGIRIALGAQTKDVIYLVARSGIIQTIAGLVLGIVLGQALTQAITQTMRITGLPPVWKTSSVAVTLILATTIVSMLAPAIKSTRIDPVKALR